MAGPPSLEFHLTNPQGRPMAGVVVSVDGSAAAPTDRKGKTRTVLNSPMQPKMWIDVGVTSPPDAILLSPWDARVGVPPFEKDSFVPLIAGRRGDRSMLESGPALASMTAHLLTARASERSESAALAETAHLFGLEGPDIDREIRGLQARSKDPYEKGMAALYARSYDDAATQLTEAFLTRGKQLRKVPADVVAAAQFLGQALFEQGKFDKAADAYRRALASRPDDPAISNGLGLALLRGGKPDLAEPFLKREPR